MLQYKIHLRLHSSQSTKIHNRIHTFVRARTHKTIDECFHFISSSTPLVKCIHILYHMRAEKKRRRRTPMKILLDDVQFYPSTVNIYIQCSFSQIFSAFACSAVTASADCFLFLLLTNHHVLVCLQRFAFTVDGKKN